MNRYRVCGTVSIDVYAEIDAPTLAYSSASSSVGASISA